MIKIKEAVIVEGKYDRIKLSSVIDGLIIETGGFRIFKDPEKMRLLRRLADSRGLLILTDSDSAGFLIRRYIQGCIPQDKIKHAYIPDLYGKEKRKAEASKEGKLGVEGVDAEIILRAIRQAGANAEKTEKTADDREEKNSRPITKLDLYEDGFSGSANSGEKRSRLLKMLDLPQHLSVNSLVSVLNSLLSYEEYRSIVEKINFGPEKD